MNYEKLKKKREKHRNKIIKKYGNADLKLFGAEDMRTADQVISRVQEYYVLGSGTCWVALRDMSELRRKELLKYMLSLEIIETCVIEETNEEYFPHKLVIKFFKDE